MPRTEPSALAYWSDAAAVDSLRTAHGALPYETALLSDAVRAAGGPASVRVVDVIGVGTGRELAAVRSVAPDSHIRAWDISPPMVAVCRETVAASGLDGIDVAVGAVDDLPPTRDAADLVVALSAVLGFSATPAQRADAVATLARRMRPAGALVAVVQQRNARPDWAAYFAARAARSALTRRAGGSPRLGSGDRLMTQGGTSVVFHHYRPAELAALFAAAGLRTDSLRSLRSWAHAEGTPIPLRSPNPLLLRATRL